MFFVWLFFYGLVMLLSHRLAILTPWAVPLGLLVSTLPLIGWLLAKGRGNLLAFKRLSLSQWKLHLFFLPYLLPVISNLLRFRFPPHAVPDVFCIFFAALLEEVLFREILLHFLCRRHQTFGIIVSSIAFGAAHLVNLENGAEPAYILYQVIYALAVGFALSGISLSCENLLPCIGIHFLINITAAASMEADILFWLCIVVCLACGIRSIRFLRKINCAKEGLSYETIH